MKKARIHYFALTDEMRKAEKLQWFRENKLGNRSALEWVLDQYKEKKPSDPTIAEKFDTYRFADYKERVIDLLRRVCWSWSQQQFILRK